MNDLFKSICLLVPCLCFYPRHASLVTNTSYDISYNFTMQGLLEGVSHSFTKNFHFIDSVKAYLSYALLRASVSPSPTVFQVIKCTFFFMLKLDNWFIVILFNSQGLMIIF